MEDSQSSLYTKFFRAFSKNDIIFEENSEGHEMFLIYSGKVQIFKNIDGQRVTIAELVEGEFFGEMALCDAAPRMASALAIEENTILIALDEDKFLYLISHQPAFALYVMQVLCTRLRTAMETLTHK